MTTAVAPGNVIELLAQALAPVLEQQKARQYGVSFKHDTAGVPSGLIYSHGPNGLLSFPGVDPVVFSAVMGNQSIIGQLPTSPSPYTNPTYYTITGVQGDVMGAGEKIDVCDDAPTAGLMKACLTTSVFGRYERATQQIEINRLGQLVDRADPMDLRLVGSPLASSAPFGGAPGGGMATPGDLFTNEVARKFWERNVSIHRLLAQQIWTGNPANNTANGGYKEMTGLALLVNTGYADAETGTACPRVDSYLSNFNYGRIDTNSTNLVAAITNMWYQVKTRASSMGLMPVRWTFAMRPQMFYEITAVWPCAYLSFRCAPGGTAVEQIDAQDAIRFRDEMRAGRYLLIDGERVEVVLDEGLPELDGNNGGGLFPRGCFASDIYLLPMSVVGGQSTLYMEYFQYQNPAIQDALGQMILGRIEGAFITWPRQTNLCVQWQSKIEPRLVLRTPFLAARLQHVVYCPIQHTDDPFPGTAYHLDGGKTSRSGPSFHTLWS